MAQTRPQVEEDEIKEIILPYVPPEVAAADIREVGKNGELFILTEAQRAKIKSDLQAAYNSADRRYSRKDPALKDDNLDYSILIHDGEFYALYKGVQRGGEAGIGSFGVVKYAQNFDTGEWVPLKILSEKHTVKKQGEITYEKDDPESIEHFAERERINLDRAGQLSGAYRRISPSKGYQHVLMMKLGEGPELESYIEKITQDDRKLPLVQWLDIFKAMCEQIHLLHETGVIHRDIKPANFRYNPVTGKMTAIDFGLSCELPEDGMKMGVKELGTPLTMAPESRQRGEYSRKSDVFSLGASIADMLGLLDPTTTKDETSRLVSRTHVNYTNNPVIKDPLVLRYIYNYLHEHLMASDPVKRPSLPEAISFLENLQKHFIKFESQEVKVGIINAEDFINADKNRRIKIANELRKYDNIVIMDTKQRAPSVYLAMSRFIEDISGVTVNHRIFTGGDLEKVAAEVPARLAKSSPAYITHACVHHQIPAVQQTNTNRRIMRDIFRDPDRSAQLRARLAEARARRKEAKDAGATEGAEAADRSSKRSSKL